MQVWAFDRLASNSTLIFTKPGGSSMNRAWCAVTWRLSNGAAIPTARAPFATPALSAIILT